MTLKKLLAWSIHLFTASGVVFGLLALLAVFDLDFIKAFWLLLLTIIIDSADGTLARLVDIKKTLPAIDGALLDNIIDYSNWTLIPGIILIKADLLPQRAAIWIVAIMIMTSALQFSQTDAKTEDHFFKGFPSYWSLVVLYLFILQLNPYANMIVVLLLSVLHFVPIKYIYPSRMEYVSSKKWFKKTFLMLTGGWVLSIFLLLFNYPQRHPLVILYTIVYIGFYMGLSVVKTLNRSRFQFK